MTSFNAAKLPSLTTGRGIAALAVVLHHAYLAWGGNLGCLGRIGWIGVSFFFILSGFVLTWSFKPDTSASTFYVHRLARIYPVHLVTLAISIALYIRFHVTFGGYTGTTWGAVANLLLVHDWGIEAPAIRQGWNGVSWSLSVEVFFYLLAIALIPTLLAWSARRLVTLCLSLFTIHLLLAFTIAYLGLPGVEDILIYHPVARLPEFIYGITAAVFFRRGFRVHLSRMVPFSMLAMLVVYSWREPWGFHPLIMIDWGVPAFIALILTGASHDLDHRDTQATRGTISRIVGEASFSLYMTHAILLSAVILLMPTLSELPGDLKVVGFLLLSTAVSIVFSNSVEVPMRSLILSSYQRLARAKLKPAVSDVVRPVES